MTRTGPYKPRKTGPDSHITRYSDSSHFDIICVLCGQNDGTNTGIAALKATCHVGGTFCGTHNIEYDRMTHPLQAKCVECGASTKLGLMGPCYEVKPTQPFDPDIDTTACDGTTLGSALSSAAQTVEKYLTNAFCPVEETPIRTDRQPAKSVETKIVGVITTPHGSLTGDPEAVRYLYDLMTKESEEQSFEADLRSLLAKHAIAAESSLVAIVSRQIVGYINLWNEGMKALDHAK